MQTPMPSTDTASCMGKLHLLDLAAIKDQLGKRWFRMADTAEKLFENAIRRNLGPEDTFVRRGELSYLMMFRHMNPREAQIKCRIISEEICQKLFGEQFSSASLRTLLAPGIAIAQDADMYGALDDFLEEQGKETIMTVARPPDGAPGNDARPEEAEEEEAAPDFTYRPLWDAVKQVIVTYICQPLPESVDEAADPLSPQFAQKMMTLDRQALHHCTDHIARLRQEQLRILTATPITFSTLTHSRLWMMYAAEMRKLPDDVSRDLAFLVLGIDNGVPNVRLSQEIPKLTHLVRNVFCQVEDGGNAGARFARAGVYAVGLTLAPSDPHPVSLERIRKLASQTMEAGLEAFVLGIETTSLLLSALDSGIRYVEGPAIRPALSNPRHAFAQSLEHIYTAKLAERRAPGP